MTSWKLQKLVYYSQAWSLVWDEHPMFGERIEAWANGPVSPDLYRVHKGRYWVDGIEGGDAKNLQPASLETIDVVLKYYGDKSPQWLSDLTHAEDPWKNARGDLPSGAYSQAEITCEAMAAFYESLPPDS